VEALYWVVGGFAVAITLCGAVEFFFGKD